MRIVIESDNEAGMSVYVPQQRTAARTAAVDVMDGGQPSMELLAAFGSADTPQFTTQSTGGPAATRTDENAGAPSTRPDGAPAAGARRRVQ